MVGVESQLIYIYVLVVGIFHGSRYKLATFPLIVVWHSLILVGVLLTHEYSQYVIAAQTLFVLGSSFRFRAFMVCSICSLVASTQAIFCPYTLSLACLHTLVLVSVESMSYGRILESKRV